MTEYNQSSGHTYKQWAFAILANTAFLIYGLQNGWLSPMAEILLSDHSPVGRPLTTAELSWMGSVPSLSGILGAFITAYAADKYGRKIGLMTIAFVQAIGWTTKLISTTPEVLILARAFCGLGAGGTFNLVPIYVKEICQDSIRGGAGLLLMISQNLGVFAMFAMGAYLDYYAVLWITCALPILAFALMFLAPETPTYLVKINKLEEAAATIANLRGLEVSNKVVQNEIDLIRCEDEAFRSIKNFSILSVFKQTAWRRGIILTVAIVFAQATNGSTAIITYASTVFKSSGATLSPELLSLSIPVFMMLASLLSMGLVERLGRKPIFVTSFLLSAASLGSLATMLLLQQQGLSLPGWMPVAAVVITVSCYAGIVPLSFLVMSEIFNFQVRTKIICCLVTEAWLVSFMQLSLYTSVTSTFGAHVTFYMFAIVNIYGFFCVMVFLPETKGKTVEQIEKELVRKKLCC